jgi:hypothetical protein
VNGNTADVTQTDARGRKRTTHERGQRLHGAWQLILAGPENPARLEFTRRLQPVACHRWSAQANQSHVIRDSWRSLAVELAQEAKRAHHRHARDLGQGRRVRVM